MTLVTWGTVKANVRKALDRDDDEIDGLLEAWRGFAEAEIYATLRPAWLMRSAVVVFLQPLEALPPSWLGCLGVTLLGVGVSVDPVRLLSGGGSALIGSAATGEVIAAGGLGEGAFTYQQSKRLEPATGENYPRYDREPGAEPQAYLIEGHTLRVLPWPEKSVGLRLYYYSRGRDLVADGDTNELLTHAPAALHYGVLRHAAIHLGRPDDEQRWGRAMAAAVDTANAGAKGWLGPGFRTRWVGERTRARLVGGVGPGEAAA